MAKKVSKRSRAARRGMAFDEHDEGKDLAAIPKLESDGVKKSIIRTTIKNENLLNKKLESQKIRKQKKNNSTIKHKKERSDRVSGVLGTKIEQSIARASFVQNARKSGWDKINSALKVKNRLPDSSQDKDDEEDQDRVEEDDYVDNFFNDDNEKPDLSSLPKHENKFSLLEQAET